MSNKKSIMRALVLCGLAMLMSISMLAGTTFAWFTDSASSGVNRIVAGNLDVELNYWDGDSWENANGVESIFNPDAKWEPGYTEVIYLQVVNKGTLAFDYRVALNILGETAGVNQEGDEFKLSDYIYFGIKTGAAEGAYDDDRDAAILAAADEGAYKLSDVANGDTHAYARRSGSLAAATPGAAPTAQTFAVVVWMPTEVNNVANHNGVDVPSISIDFSVAATQDSYESDSIDSGYDAEAGFPTFGAGASEVKGNTAEEITVRDNSSAKVATVNVPSAAIADGAKVVSVKVEETIVNKNITIAADEAAVTYEITATGIAEGNTAPITVQLRTITGLDPATVKVYHYEELVQDTRYDPFTGYITFEVTSFSPYTIVYNVENEYEAPSTEGVGAPVANIVYLDQYVGADKITNDPSDETKIYWNNWGGLYPTEDLDAYLDAAFSFEATESYEEAMNSPYAYWNADFVVELDCDLEANQIFLGGNYGGFGWVGFHYTDEEVIPANTEIALLGSFSNRDDGLSGWTYLDIVDAVGKFYCGVGDHDAALDGAKFTVALRLTNPENTAEWVDVATVVYTFGGAYVIE